MKRLVRSFTYGEKGFTLLELLVVIAILGVLSAIAVPNLTGMIARAKEGAALAEKAIIQTAMTTMMVDNRIDSVNFTAATDEMDKFPSPGKGKPLYPDYLRTKKTSRKYTNIGTGEVFFGE